MQKWSMTDKTRQSYLEKTLKMVPCDLINQTCLEQQVSSWQEIVTDKVLIGPHCHTMAHTQGAQYLQHLEHNLLALNPAITW